MKRDFPGNQVFLLVFGLFWIAFPVGIFFFEMSVYEKLASEGVEISAEIVGKHIYTDSDDDDTYYITVVYFADDPDLKGDKKNIEKDFSISYDRYVSVEIGTRIGLVYARSNPTTSRLTIQLTQSAKNEMFLILSIFGGIGLIILGSSFVGFFRWWFVK
jgi:hypothetical protein